MFVLTPIDSEINWHRPSLSLSNGPSADAGCRLPVRALAAQHALDGDPLRPGGQSPNGARSAVAGGSSIPGQRPMGCSSGWIGHPLLFYPIGFSLTSIP